MKMSEKASKKVLQITQSMYEEWKDRLIVKRLIHQEIKDMVLLGLNDPEGKLNLSQEEKNKLQSYLDSGVLEETEDAPDWEVAKEYEKALDAKLLEAIEKGELPKYTLTFLKKKTRKYVRRTTSDNK